MKKKHCLPMLGLALTICLIITSCPSGNNIEPDPGPGNGPVIITETDLTDLVGTPFPNSTPKNEFDGEQFSGFINWRNEDGTNFSGSVFEKDTVYTAVVALTAAEGYTFEGFTGTFTHDYADEISANGTVVTIIFERTGMEDLVDEMDLSDLVTIPTDGGTPQAVFTSQEQYIGQITWYSSNDVNHVNQEGFSVFTGSTFSPGIIYRAVLTLTATEGNTFNGLAANSFIYEPTAARYDVSNVINSGTVSITFKPVAFTYLMSSANSAITVKACCDQPGSTGRDYGAEKLIDGVLTSGNGWNYIWGDTGTGYYLNELIAISGNPQGHISGINYFCGTGHFDALSKVPAITDPDKQYAHFITYDLGEAREIAGIAYYPENNGIHMYQQPGLLEYEIFISNTVEIGVDPYVTGVTSVGQGFFEMVNAADVTDRYLHWQSIDLTALNNGTPVNARYVQVRIYRTTSSTGPTEEIDWGGYRWVKPTAGELTIALNVDPATLPDIIVNKNLDLTNLVTVPVSGVAPQTAFTAQDQYSATISWENDSGTPAGSIFETSTVYKAVITLTANNFFTFTGFTGDFIHTDAGNVNFSGNTVTITFPVTEDALVVSATDLTSLVAVPVLGQTPITTPINEDQYTGEIAWLDEDDNSFTGTFDFYRNYTAIVTLTAQSGYTFTGIAVSSFTHAGAESVGNDANSGTVTVTFRVRPEFLDLSAVSPSPIKACCWTTDFGPHHLLTNNVAGALAGTNRWVYGIDGSSWPEDLPNIGNPSGGWGSRDADYGHNMDISGGGQPTWPVPPLAGHFFTIDLGEKKNISSIEYHPSIGNAHHFAEGSIFISDNDIGVIHDLSPDAEFAFDVLTDGIKWYEINIAAQNGGTAVSGQYIQIRFTEISTPGTGWFNADLGLLRIAVEQ